MVQEQYELAFPVDLAVEMKAVLMATAIMIVSHVVIFKLRGRIIDEEIIFVFSNRTSRLAGVDVIVCRDGSINH